MPRVDFQLWDRVYILKLICTAQATYSSFVVLIYIYLILLQDWTTSEGNRSDIIKLKWSVIVAGALDFGLGILLAFAANTNGIRCRKRILIWIISETFLIPISIFLLMQLHKRIISSNQFHTDTHYSRVNIGLIPAQVCFLLTQYLFIAYAIDFLVHGQRKAKTYDPSIRPKTVYAPTDPQITTTESRHIRMSQSLLFQPSSSKAFPRNMEREGNDTPNEYFQKELAEWNKDEKKKEPERRETENLNANENFTVDKKIEGFQIESKKMYARLKDWAEDKKTLKNEEWMREEKTEWLQCDYIEKEGTTDQEREWTDDEKEWRRDDNYWMRVEMGETNKEKENKEYEKDRFDWAELEARGQKHPKDRNNQNT